MRELRFVRLSEDGSHLVVAAAGGSEHFGLLVEPALQAAVATPPRLAEAAPEAAETPAAVPAAPPGPTVTPGPVVPREIQVRVRGGESPEEVAESLGVELDRILRFALPVVDERRRIAEEARRARARHTAPEGTDSKLVVFGEAVDARYAAHGIDPLTVAWDSHRRADGEWVVAASWLGGEGQHGAEWVFHRGSRTVTPIDDTAADLLSDRPIRPVAPPVPEPPRLVVAPPLMPGVVAFPPMPDAHTGPIERVEEVFDQEAAPPLPAALRPALVREDARGAEAVRFGDDSAAQSPTQDTARIDFDAPPLPLGIAEPAGRPEVAAPRRARRELSEEDRAARARIPSWDDILLGVRRKSD